MAKNNPIEVSDFLDTTVAPNQLNNELRDEALKEAYAAHPGLEQLVEGTRQIDTGIKELTLGVAATSAAILLGKTSVPLATLATVFGVGAAGKGVFDIALGHGEREAAEKALKDDPSMADLLKQSRDVSISGMGVEANWGVSAAATIMLRARRPWQAAVPLATTLIGGAYSHLQQNDFESQLDLIVRHQLDK